MACATRQHAIRTLQRRRDRVRRLAAELRGAGRVRALPGHGPRAAAAVRSTALPGIPTIRPFEALACGIPLVAAPWRETRRPVHAGRRLRGRRRWRGDERSAARGWSADDAARAQAGRPRARDRARRAHLRAPRGPAPRDCRRDSRDRAMPASGHGSDRVNIAFFGSSLVSAYWNGAATYYRGIVRGPARRAGTRSRSTSRTRTAGSSTATSPTRPGPRWSSTRARATDGVARALEQARARGRDRQGERRRRVRRAARARGARRAAAGSAGRLLGRGRACDAGPRRMATLPTRSCRSFRSTTWC